MGGEWFLAAMLGIIGAALVYVGVAEHYEQKANRAACPGRYIQTGDYRDSGICIRSDAVIWEKR